jgi:hypothetical protein
MTTEQQIPDEVSQNAMASSTATGPVVVLRDVVKTYDGDSLKVTAIDGITLWQR